MLSVIFLNSKPLIKLWDKISRVRKWTQLPPSDCPSSDHGKCETQHLQIFYFLFLNEPTLYYCLCIKQTSSIEFKFAINLRKWFHLLRKLIKTAGRTLYVFEPKNVLNHSSILLLWFWNVWPQTKLSLLWLVYISIYICGLFTTIHSI